jgi:hypothetical protein
MGARSYWRCPICALFAMAMILLTITGCGAQHQSSSVVIPQPTSTKTPMGISDRIVPPVILADTSPSNLDVYVSLNVGGYDTTSRDITFIGFGFTSQQRNVQFAAGERFTCGDHNLMRPDGTIGPLELPTGAVAGKTLNCRYVSGQTSAEITFTTPIPPTILSPADHAEVARNATTTIRYRRGSSIARSYGVVALGGTKTISLPHNTGPAQAMVDTTALHPGAGTISLAVEGVPPNTHSSPFKSFLAESQSMTYIDVIWT